MQRRVRGALSAHRSFFVRKGAACYSSPSPPLLAEERPSPSPFILHCCALAKAAPNQAFAAPQLSAGKARAPPHWRDGRGHEAFVETTMWTSLHPPAMDTKIPILSALDNHFSGAMNGSNRLFSARADHMAVFLSGLFHTNRFRPYPSPSASLFKYGKHFFRV